MKKLLAILALAATAHAQQTIYGSRTIEGSLVINGTRTGISRGTSLPGTCTVGDVFFKTDATAGQNLYGCTVTNTWSVLAGSGSGITSLNALTGATQTFAKVDDANMGLTIGSIGTAHTFTLAWIGTLAKSRQHASTAYVDAGNTYTTGTQDFSLAGALLIRLAAGCAPTASASFCYDSTAHVYKGGANGSGKTFAFTDSNVATASALAANGANCSSGSAPLGVDAAGAVEGCFDVGTQAEVDAKVSFTTSGSDPAGACTVGAVHFNSSNDTFWVCNDTTWSPQLQYFKDTSAPTTCTSGYAGAIYVRTTNGAVYACDGTNYQIVGGGAISGLTTNTLPLAASSTTLGDSNLLQHASTGALLLAKNLSFPTATPITASATPTWDLSLNNVYTFAPTANVSSWTISSAPAGAATVTLVITNDSTPRTIAAPTGFVGFDGPDPTASSVTVQVFEKVGSTYYGLPSRCLSNCSTGFLEGLKGTAPSTPAANYLRLFWDASKNLTDIDDAGASRIYPAQPSANGMVARTASGAYTGRTIAGTSNELTVTNGDGVSGAPSLAIAATLDLSAKTSTKPSKAGTSLPGTCGVGETYIKTDATNTAQWYICTATNTWTAQGGGSSGFDPFDSTNSLLIEDFYPSGSWSTGANVGASNIRVDTANGASGSLASIAGIAHHPGIVACSTGTTSGRGCSLHYAYGAGYDAFPAASHTFEMHAVVKFATTMTGQDVYFGLIPGAQVVSQTPTTGIWIRKLTGDTNWQFVCDDSSVTTTDSGVAPVADTWYTIKIYSSAAGTIKFRIYSGVTALGSEVTISTNVPAAALGPVLLHTGDGTNRVLHIDRMALKLTGMTR